MYFLGFGYIVPLILGLFTDNPTIKIVFFTIGMITQMFFWALEYSEV